MGRKNVLLIAGVHGDEQNAIKVCNDVVKKNPWKLLILPESEEARKKNVRCIDGYDWNRHAEEIDLKNASDYNVIMDVHCSPNLQNCVVIDNNRYAANYIKFCNENDIPYALVDAKDTIKNSVIKYNSLFNKYGSGIAAFTVELNGMGITDKATYESNVKFLTTLVEAFCKSDIDFYAEQELVDFTSMLVIVKCNENTYHNYGEKLFTREHIQGFYRKGETILTLSFPGRTDTVYIAPADGWVIDYDNCPYAYFGNSLFEFQKKILIQDDNG